MLNRSFSSLMMSFSTRKEGKSIYLLTYQFVEDMYYKRLPYKQAHNKLIENLEKSQKAKIVGGSMFPMEKAYIWFNCEEKSLVEDFVKSDPYTKNGLIKEHNIEKVETKSGLEFDELVRNFKYLS